MGYVELIAFCGIYSGVVAYSLWVTFFEDVQNDQIS